MRGEILINKYLHIFIYVKRSTNSLCLDKNSQTVSSDVIKIAQLLSFRTSVTVTSKGKTIYSCLKNEIG